MRHHVPRRGTWWTEQYSALFYCTLFSSSNFNCFLFEKIKTLKHSEQAQRQTETIINYNYIKREVERNSIQLTTIGLKPIGTEFGPLCPTCGWVDLGHSEPRSGSRCYLECLSRFFQVSSLWKAPKSRGNWRSVAITSWNERIRTLNSRHPWQHTSLTRPRMSAMEGNNGVNCPALDFLYFTKLFVNNA